MGTTRPGKEGERRKGNRLGCWASCQGRRAGRGARNRWRPGFWAKKGRELWLGDDKILQCVDELEGIHATLRDRHRRVPNEWGGSTLTKSRLRGVYRGLLTLFSLFISWNRNMQHAPHESDGGFDYMACLMYHDYVLLARVCLRLLVLVSGDFKYH